MQSRKENLQAGACSVLVTIKTTKKQNWYNTRRHTLKFPAFPQPSLIHSFLKAWDPEPLYPH